MLKAQKNSLHHKSLAAVASLLATVLVVHSFTAPAQAQITSAPLNATATVSAEPKNLIDLFEYRHPETKELIKFQYEPTSRAQLEKFKPSQLRKQIETVGVPPAVGIKGFTKQMVLDFPAEMAAFTVAQALSVSFHATNDPSFAKTFVEQNASAAGVVSFAGFIVGNRASQAFLQALGVAYDPRRSPLDYRIPTPTQPAQIYSFDVATSGGKTSSIQHTIPGRREWERTRVVLAPAGPTRVQRVFAPFLGPVGLMAGMSVSNVIHELMADKNLTACTKGTYFPPKNLSEADLKTHQEKVDAACDQFFQDFALSKKAMDYMPDLMAMALGGYIHGHLVNKLLIGGTKEGASKAMEKFLKKNAITIGQNGLTGGIAASTVKAGSEKYIPFVLRSLRIAGQLGSIGSGGFGKFVLTAGNVWVFMEIVHPITPLIKKPFERSRQGNDITSRIDGILHEIDRAEKNKWVWLPKTEADVCGPATMFETDALGNPTHFSTCFVPDQFAPDFLLKEMAKRQAKWREFILQDAYLAHTGWQSYVSKFATMYANAWAFYEQIGDHLNFQRFDPKAAAHPSYFFEATPLYGLWTDPEKKDAASAREAVANARAWLETYLEGQRLKERSSNFRMRATERESLAKILTGLKAWDEKVSLAELGSIEAGFRNLSAMKDSERQAFELKVRSGLLSDAISELRRVLEKDFVYNHRNIPLDSPQYKRMAETNPFMSLRLRLGNPEPLPEGLALVRDSNDDENIIEQISKHDHPSGIGRARVNSMTEYLALSMVCGPEVGTTDGTDERYIPKFKSGAVVTEWKGFEANFRPPRIVDTVPSDICSTWADNSSKDKSTYNPFEGRWTIGRTTYDGLLDIIRKHARKDIVGTALPPEKRGEGYESPFNQWWTKNIDPHVTATVVKLRSQYRLILKEKFIPALTQGGPENVKKYNGREFKMGALESLYDEAKLYLLIVGKTSNIARNSQARNQFDTISTGIMLEFKNLASLVTDLQFVEEKGIVAKTAYEQKRSQLEGRIQDLAKFVEERQKLTSATVDSKKIDEQVLKNLNGLMAEMDSYWGVVRGIQVVGQ